MALIAISLIIKYIYIGYFRELACIINLGSMNMGLALALVGCCFEGRRALAPLLLHTQWMNIRGLKLIYILINEKILIYFTNLLLFKTLYVQFSLYMYSTMYFDLFLVSDDFTRTFMHANLYILSKYECLVRIIVK